MGKQRGSYLIAVKAIEQSDADHRSSDPRVMGKCGKGQGFHFHIDDVLLMDLMEEVELLFLSIVAEGSIQSSLT